MANAFRDSVTTTKEVQVTEDQIVLKLSRDEAEVVQELCVSVRGAGKTRDLVDDISRALHDVGMGRGPWLFEGEITVQKSSGYGCR